MGFINFQMIVNFYAALIALAAWNWSYSAAKDDNTRAVEVSGCEVQCIEEVAIPALKSGPIAKVMAQVNDEVKAGATIAQLDDRQWQLQRHTAKLERDAAAEKVADDVELQYAMTAQREAEEELKSTMDVLKKTPGAVNEVTLRRLRLTAERAALDVEQTRKMRRLAEIALSVRSSELQSIDEQLARLNVVSPLDGVLREIHRRPGEWIAEGETIAKLARLDRLRVDALVDAKSMEPVRSKGCRVAVRWEHLGESRACNGRVVSIDPQMYAGSQWRIHAEIDNTRDGNGWKLLPGTEVQMTVYPGTAQEPLR